MRNALALTGVFTVAAIVLGLAAWRNQIVVAQESAKRARVVLHATNRENQQTTVAFSTQTLGPDALNQQYTKANDRTNQLARDYQAELRRWNPRAARLSTLKDQLVRQLNTVFVIRQKMQQEELAAYRDRLNDIEARIRRRAVLQERIVDRRVKELTAIPPIADGWSPARGKTDHYGQMEEGDVRGTNSNQTNRKLHSPSASQRGGERNIGAATPEGHTPSGNRQFADPSTRARDNNQANDGADSGASNPASPPTGKPREASEANDPAAYGAEAPRSQNSFQPRAKAAANPNGFSKPAKPGSGVAADSDPGPGVLAETQHSNALQGRLPADPSATGLPRRFSAPVPKILAVDNDYVQIWGGSNHSFEDGVHLFVYRGSATNSPPIGSVMVIESSPQNCVARAITKNVVFKPGDHVFVSLQHKFEAEIPKIVGIDGPYVQIFGRADHDTDRPFEAGDHLFVYRENKIDASPVGLVTVIRVKDSTCVAKAIKPSKFSIGDRVYWTAQHEQGKSLKSFLSRELSRLQANREIVLIKLASLELTAAEIERETASTQTAPGKDLATANENRSKGKPSEKIIEQLDSIRAGELNRLEAQINDIQRRLKALTLSENTHKKLNTNAFQETPNKDLRQNGKSKLVKPGNGKKE